MLLSLPTRKSLRLVWNLGSLLGMLLAFQIATGLLLALIYGGRYESVNYIMSETRRGFALRLVHFNGARALFLVLYLHLFKGLLMRSYRLREVWRVGVVLLLLIMAAGFTGYVLVNAQMRFWASIVIVNFFRVIPLIGEKLVLLILGGFIVGTATTKFFFVIHFLSPFLILVVILLHLYFLHATGSTSSIPLLERRRKIYFSPSYGVKDSLNLVVLLGLVIGSFLYPFNLGDPEMFSEANPLLSPSHIVPEWYFLSRYAILRSIPNKSLGLVALVGRFAALWRLSLLTSYVTPLKRNKFVSFFFLGTFLLLSTLGSALVEAPFTALSLYVTCLYFGLLLSYFLLEKVYEKVLQ